MTASLFFVGTGSEETLGVRNAGGFVIKTSQAILLVDPGPGAGFGMGQAKLKPTGMVIAHPDRGHDASLFKVADIQKQHKDIELERKEKGVLFRLPDCTVSYITNAVLAKEAEQYRADVVIFSNHENTQKIIEKLRPKLVILTHFTETLHKQNPVYHARELQKATGIQTIAAEDGLTVDLDSYSALPAQKSLAKFTSAE